VSFDVVGYGLQEIKPTQLAERSRLKATVQLVNLRSALTDGFNIHHTGSPGTGGGTCFGDSGGPIFLAGTNTIVAVTSFGLNENCAGGGFGYRVDTQAVAAWLDQFI
jgi:secreted trypsin-like serine protease